MINAVLIDLKVLPVFLIMQQGNVQQNIKNIIFYFRNDIDDVLGCEKYRFSFGADEMMMNAEAGLYFKFDEENGIPKNCEGLDHFNMDNWMKNGGKADTIRRAYHMNCPLNDRSLPDDDKPVSEIIADYADSQVISFITFKSIHKNNLIDIFNQDLWVNDFIGAFEKMMRNGYQDGDLTDAPGTWENVVCKMKNKVMTCLQKY